MEAAASLQTSPTSPVSALSMVSATQNFAGEKEPAEPEPDTEKGESSDKPEPWSQVALDSFERQRVSKCTETSEFFCSDCFHLLNPGQIT